MMIDVGANYGYFSCLWASQNPKNRVLAFEASPFNVQPLRNNVDKNGLNDRIQIIPIAIGKEKGELKFSLGNENQQTGWGGFTMDNDPASVDVQVDTLDSYAFKNNISKIEVLKIDTEGADTWVLYGAKTLLEEKKINHIFFEHNIDRMKLLNIGEMEAEKFLKDVGYTVEKHSDTDYYAHTKN